MRQLLRVVHRLHHQIDAGVCIVHKHLAVLHLPRAVALVLAGNRRVHRPAQPVAHQRRIHHPGQQDDVVLLAQQRHLGNDLLFPASAHKVDVIALLLVHPAARPAQMHPRGQIDRRRAVMHDGHGGVGVLVADLFLRVDCDHGQAGEDDVEVVERLVGVGHHLVLIALPDGLRAGIVGIIVRKAEVHALRVRRSQVKHGPLIAVVKAEGAVERAGLRIIRQRRAVVLQPGDQRHAAHLPLVLNRPDLLDLAHRPDHRRVRRGQQHDGSHRRAQQQRRNQKTDSLHLRASHLFQCSPPDWPHPPQRIREGAPAPASM